jgi:CO dehydrogenase maturation factor
VSVYRQYVAKAAGFGVATALVGNKVADEHDRAFLTRELGHELACWRDSPPHVRAAERGEPAADQPPRADQPRHAVGTSPQGGCHREGLDHLPAPGRGIHTRNAAAWGDLRTGENLANQIDPNFVHGPGALARSSCAPSDQ